MFFSKYFLWTEKCTSAMSWWDGISLDPPSMPLPGVLWCILVLWVGPCQNLTQVRFDWSYIKTVKDEGEMYCLTPVLREKMRTHQYRSSVMMLKSRSLGSAASWSQEEIVLPLWIALSLYLLMEKTSVPNTRVLGVLLMPICLERWCLAQ